MRFDKKKALNIAMVGYGFMGRAHSNAFTQVNHFFDTPYQLNLKVICGRNRAALEPMAARWGWQEIETDWSAIIKRPDIDIIDIAAPNYLHFDIAIAAARAGKIVFCEKPLAISAQQAEEMALAARDVPNLVWFNYRRVPAITLAQRLIAEGRLGEIFQYRATYLQSWGPGADDQKWRFRLSDAGSGVMGDLLSHSIDIALLLNGAIESLVGIKHTFASGREVDDAVLVLTRFANGSLGSFEATRYAIGYDNRNGFEIHGSLGMIRFDLENLNHLQFFDGSIPAHLRGLSDVSVTHAGHPYVENFWPPGHIIGYEHTFIATLADFLMALATGEPFHPDFDDAFAVQRVLDCVEQSSSLSRWVNVSRAAGSNEG